MVNVTVFRAFNRGQLRQIALSREQLLRLCPEAAGPGWEVHSTVEKVETAAGVVIDWNRHGGSARCPKIHWRCPHCGGKEHFSDFDLADSNPVLWFCESGSGQLCLVHWQHEESA